MDASKDTSGRRLDADNIVGNRSVLAVKIISSTAEYSSSEDFLSNSVFGTQVGGFTDTFNLVSGYDQCSYGQMTFYPVPDRTGNTANVKNGVVSITVPGKPEDGTVLSSQAATEIAAQFGIAVNDIADHVLYCLPPGTMTGASASSGGFWSQYDDTKCNSPSFQMHEVGHNLGLLHS